MPAAGAAAPEPLRDVTARAGATALPARPQKKYRQARRPSNPGDRLALTCSQGAIAECGLVLSIYEGMRRALLVVVLIAGCTVASDLDDYDRLAGSSGAGGTSGATADSSAGMGTTDGSAGSPGGASGSGGVSADGSADTSVTDGSAGAPGGAGGVGAGGSAGGVSGSGGEGAGGAAGGGGIGGAGQCQVMLSGGGACSACLETRCCSQAEQCFVFAPVCNDLSRCLDNTCPPSKDPNACLMEECAAFAGGASDLNAYSECIAMQCATECPWASNSSGSGGGT